MFAAVFGSVELGLIYAIMALGVYLTFRVLDFPDLTVDGSFVTGAAVVAMMLTFGYSPIVATLAAVVAGFIAGTMTGILHTKGNINPLLSGILMMIALYSINLRIMGLTTETSVGRPNIPLLNETTLFSSFIGWWETIGIDAAIISGLQAIGIQHPPKTIGIFLFMLLVIVMIKWVVDFFLETEIGLALRATGNNKKMIRSFSANTDSLIILGVGVSNALVALAGGLIAQYMKSADIGMGIGMIIIGLASVIIGEAIFGTKTVMRTTFAVIIGAIIYRVILGLALRIEFLDAGDMKLITAVIVILALVVPQQWKRQKEKQVQKKRRTMLMMEEVK